MAQKTPRARPVEMRRRYRAIIGVLRSHPNELLTLGEIWPADTYLDSLTMSQVRLAVKQLVKEGRITRIGMRYCAKRHAVNGDDHEEAEVPVEQHVPQAAPVPPRIVIESATGTTYMVIGGQRFPVTIE
jgi:hypothetical protein